MNENAVLCSGRTVCRGRQGCLQLKCLDFTVAKPNPDFVGYKPGPSVVCDQVAKKYRNEHDQRELTVNNYKSTGVNITLILAQGSTVEIILLQAIKLQVGLILLGTMGEKENNSIIYGFNNKGGLGKVGRVC